MAPAMSDIIQTDHCQLFGVTVHPGSHMWFFFQKVKTRKTEFIAEFCSTLNLECVKNDQRYTAGKKQQ